MTKQDEFTAYMQRYCRTRTIETAQAAKLKIIREVGISYGLTDLEIDDLFKSHFGV